MLWCINASVNWFSVSGIFCPPAKKLFEKWTKAFVIPRRHWIKINLKPGTRSYCAVFCPFEIYTGVDFVDGKINFFFSLDWLCPVQYNKVFEFQLFLLYVTVIIFQNLENDTKRLIVSWRCWFFSCERGVIGERHGSLDSLFMISVEGISSQLKH